VSLERRPVWRSMPSGGKVMEKREEGCHTQQSLPSHPILYEVTEK